jgi:hypothetical protein
MGLDGINQGGMLPQWVYIGIPTILPNQNGIIGDLMGLDGINRGGVLINHDGDIMGQWDI